jgi:hypothetical protein
MAVTGRKPKPDGQKVNHHDPTHEWVEVENVVYRGRRPSLLADAPPETRAWWRAVSAMPHCALWTATEWRFALDTARLHAAFIDGDMARAAELRLRERALGTTADALRDLRIRHIELVTESVHEASATVTDFDAERWRRLNA